MKKSINNTLLHIVTSFVLVIICIIVYSVYLYLIIAPVSFWGEYPVTLKPTVYEGDIDAVLSDVDINNDYLGYYYADNLSECETNIGLGTKNIKAFHLSENIAIKDRSIFMKGSMFEFKDSYDVLPVILVGHEYFHIPINYTFEIRLFSKVSNEVIEKECIVVGKIQFMSIPQFESQSLEEMYENSQNLIVIPDVYRDMIFEEPNRLVLQITNITPELLEAILNNALITFPNEDYMLKQFIPAYLMIVIISIVALAYFLYLQLNYIGFDYNKKINMKFILYIFSICTAVLIAIVIIKRLSSHIIIGYSYSFIVLGIFLLCSALIYAYKFKQARRTTLTQEKSHYEKI